VYPREFDDPQVSGGVVYEFLFGVESTAGATQVVPDITGSAPEPPLGSPSRSRNVASPCPDQAIPKITFESVPRRSYRAKKGL
jgi:hypothetical protein